MKDNLVIEIGVGVVLAALVGVLIYAHSAWMPDMATMLVLVLIVASFATFTMFVWKEQGGDERDILIRHIGSRWAFLATGTVLLIGTIVETLINHAPNIWLGLALIIMVGAKIIGHAYGRRKY